MGSHPIYSYKTSSISGVPPGPKTGKAGTAGTSGTSPTTSIDSYMGKLETEGYKKLGKAPPQEKAPSGDPVAELQDALDKLNKEGVPEGNLAALDKFITHFSAEAVLSKFPDAPQDVLAKINSIIDTFKKKTSDLKAGIASGTGTPQQVQAAQQALALFEKGLGKMTAERDKVAAIIPQKEKFWATELKNFQEKGGSSDVRDFDLDDDSWIGRPDADGSYRIGVRKHDKAFEDPENKRLSEAGSTIQYKFKKGEEQFCAINPKTSLRVHFDPKTKKVIGEQVAAPGYKASIGTDFAGEDNPNLTLDDKGVLQLKAQHVSNTQNFAEAGMQLFTVEYLWVKMDSDGEIDMENGTMQPAPFELKEGHLAQKMPAGDEAAHYKQVYVKEMKVRTDDANGNTLVEFRGGDDNAKIFGMRIAGPDSGTKASDVALAITSGTGDGHRETPIVLDAGGYESTSRVGIKDPKHFASQFNYDGAKHATGPQADQINDTLKHFVAGDSGKIDSLLPRGIAFKARGYITGTGGNDLLVVEPKPDFLTVKDGASITVFDGQGGHNAIFGQDTGSVFATGITMASIENTKDEAEIGIGINAFGEKASTSGSIGPTTSESDKSNKLYIHVKAPDSKVAVQSAVDGKLTDPGSRNPLKDVWDEGDDYYDVSGNEVRTNALDANSPNQFFDPDLWPKEGRKPIKGKIGPAATGDFLMGGDIYKEKTDKLVDSIKKKSTEKEDEWKVDGTTRSWMKGKYYQGDKTTLNQFFAGFSNSKINELDPFKQLDKGMAQASGGDE